jgi:hypothetical protein
VRPTAQLNIVFRRVASSLEWTHVMELDEGAFVALPPATAERAPAFIPPPHGAAHCGRDVP